jgi:membrane protease YdiL (CAAX protease family)
LNGTAKNNQPRRWRVLGRVVLFILCCAVILAVVSPLMSKLPGAWPQFVLGAVASLGAFALTVLFVRWEGLCLEEVGAAPGRRSLPRFVFGFLIGLLLVALSASIQTAAGHLQWVRTPGAGFGSTIITLLGFVALSCREELAFHGYPLRRLQPFFGLWGAQMIVAMVFALEHKAGGWPLSRALLGAGAGSLVFGMAAIATRGLAVPIGVHAAWNFGDWILGGKESPGLWNAVITKGQEGNAQSLRTVSYLAAMGLAMLAFWLWHRRDQNRDVSD